jgi:hypothetical protein
MIDEKFQSEKEVALLIADIIVRESPSSDKELQSKELSILTAKSIPSRLPIRESVPYV